MNSQIELVRLNPLAPALVPETRGAAGRDLITTMNFWLYPGQTKLIPTGIAIRMPESMCGMILSRSGLGSKNLVVTQGVGLIDSDYQKEIFVPLTNRGLEGPPAKFTAGQRIAQIVFVPVFSPSVQLVEAFEDNGRGGFGSTG